MKHLRDFLVFDLETFLKEKTLMVTECKPWQDFDTKDICGTKVEVAIVKDNTIYKNKDGETYKNYIGGATFLEMYDAFRLGKIIYLMNDIPKGMLFDEIEGFNPIVLNGNIDLVK